MIRKSNDSQTKPIAFIWKMIFLYIKCKGFANIPVTPCDIYDIPQQSQSHKVVEVGGGGGPVQGQPQPSPHLAAYLSRGEAAPRHPP